MSRRTSQSPVVRRAAARAPSDPGRSGVPSAAYPPAPPAPPFPRRPLRQLLEQPGMAVSGRARRPGDDVDTLLLTPPGADGPRLTVKIPATGYAELEIEREARMLVEVRRLELGRLRATIPRFVQLCEHDDRMVLVASALPGRKLPGAFCGPATVSHRRCRPAELRVAGAWLAQFQEMTQGGPGTVEMLGDELLERLDRRAREPVDGRHDMRTVADRAHRTQELLARHEAPRSAVHGNFRASHVLVDDEGAQVSGVLGWRRAATRGEPLTDIGRFAVTHPGHGPVRQALPGTTLLSGRGVPAEQTRRFVEEGLARLGLPPALWYAVAWAATASLLTEADVAVDQRRAALVTRMLAHSAEPGVMR